MSNAIHAPVQLSKGANVGLRELDAQLGSVAVILEIGGHDGHAVDADVSVFMLDADGKVRSSDDFIFYNQPIALAGAVHLRDKMRSDEDGSYVSSDMVTLELDGVPDDVARIVLCGSMDLQSGATFGSADFVCMRLRRSADAYELLVFDIEDGSTETALLFGEFYRRDGEWRVRAIGQGYKGGLPTLAAQFGVDVEASAAPGSQESGAPVPSDAKGQDAMTVGAGSQSSSEAAPTVVSTSSTSRRVSVRRVVRPPKMPADWDKTVPSDDETDWQPARLFPVAGIGGGEEQERRATSALLAVMTTVREFGRALTTRFGAPAGRLETFVEVPFGHDDQAYRPDGVVLVTWGSRTWTALVEVKTADAKLAAAQVEAYVEIAQAKKFDAVITISNQLSSAGDDHPLGFERRKLKKVALHHLSWDQVRTEAILLTEHRGVADPTQRKVLEEFVRYMRHARSGLQGFTDMGPQWVAVREGVKTKTLRSNDRGTLEVATQFDQLVRHIGLQLSSLLGVDVQAAPPRNGGDSTTRCQQLADSGLLFGSLRVPGAVGAMVLTADLRAERVGCSITVDGPREGRPATRVNWLMRQLPNARDSVRVEALLAGGRGQSTAQLLGPLRKTPEGLVPGDGRDIRAFRVSLDMPMGSKRGVGRGSLIGSVMTVANCFYAEVVQNLGPWTAKPPRMPTT
jgi:stress response protein SCP2